MQRQRDHRIRVCPRYCDIRKQKSMKPRLRNEKAVNPEKAYTSHPFAVFTLSPSIQSAPAISPFLIHSSSCGVSFLDSCVVMLVVTPLIQSRVCFSLAAALGAVLSLVSNWVLEMKIWMMGHTSTVGACLATFLGDAATAQSC